MVRCLPVGIVFCFHQLSVARWHGFSVFIIYLLPVGMVFSSFLCYIILASEICCICSDLAVCFWGRVVVGMGRSRS